MTAAVFDALPLSPECGDPNPNLFAIDYGCLNDCFPRYIPWVEQSRTPDFAGGDPVLEWTRGKGWEQREECVVPATSLIVYATFNGTIPVLDADVTIWLDGSLVPWLAGIPLAGGNVNFGPMPPGTTTVKVQGNSPTYGILDMGDQAVPPSGTYTYWLDYQPV